MITAAILCFVGAVVVGALYPPPRFLSGGLLVAIGIVLLIARFMP